MASFADAEIPTAMRDGKIPGVVFVVVRNTRVLCEKAYGVADLETQEPVSTSMTLFRVASISKILTAAAVLQLADVHQLDLQLNVNTYLTRFHIPSAFGRPITVSNLLTHSSGFDDCQFGYAARTRADKSSLRDYLMEHQPVRVRPPGLFSVYDNYGFALAGYLVQRISGIPFADYVREHIQDPLGMVHSSFSPDAVLRRELATGYWLDGDAVQACRQSYINITPAAGFCTTADDMSDFLIALLANQRPDGVKCFPASVIRGLETRQFGTNPELPGRCYGFNRVIIAGRLALRQTGQWPGFNSVLLLFPKQHCGLFLAYNLCDYLHMEQDISRQFAKEFIPPDLPTGLPTKMRGLPSSDSFAPLLGTYLSARSSHDAPQLALPHEIEVSRLPGGNLEVDGNPFREIEPMVFEKIETRESGGVSFGQRVAFRLERNGAVVDLITQSAAYRRVHWWESAHGRIFLMDAVSVVFLSVVVLWPIMTLVRLTLVNAMPGSAVQSCARRQATLSWVARGTALATCALALWFEASLALTELQLKPFADFYGFPAPVKHLLWTLPVLLVFTVALVPFTLVVWRKRLWHPAHRLHYTLLLVALGLFLYIFYARHLLFIG